MRMPYPQKDREYMVREALKAKAPKMYRELKKKGKLDKFVKEQADLLLAEYSSQLVDAHIRADLGPKASYQEQLSAHLHTLNQLTEQILAQVLNYQDPPTT
jgi:hypothetical protein